MKTLRVSNIGTKGLNTDLAPWELPPEFITFGVNYRASGNKIVTTNAYDLWTAPGATFDAGHLLSVEVALGNFWLVMGRSAVQVYDGATWTSISSTAGYASLVAGDELNWSSCMLGSIPVINNPKVHPEYWSPQSTGQILQPLEFSPGVTWLAANKSFKVIRSYKNFLFALNLVEGGVEQPNSYRWSHPADINGLPYTWDETDPSSIASIEQVLGDNGPIVDGLTLRDSFCIYSERGITILDQGGEFIFNARELSGTYGLLNSNSLVEVKGVHYFLSDGDIFRNDGNSIQSIVHNRIRDRINSQINVDTYIRSFAVLNKANKEIWFCVPENESVYPDTAYIYNWVDDSWAVKILPPNIAHAGYGTITAPPITWDTVTGTALNDNATWGTEAITPLNQTVVGVDATTSGLVIINPLANSATVEIASRLERTDLPLDGLGVVTTITRAYPHMKGLADVQIQLGSQEFPGAPIQWKPAHVFNPTSDRKLDIRTTGELHAWRVQSISTGSFEISGITFEYEDAGKR